MKFTDGSELNKGRKDFDLTYEPLNNGRGHGMYSAGEVLSIRPTGCVMCRKLQGSKGSKKPVCPCYFHMVEQHMGQPGSHPQVRALLAVSQPMSESKSDPVLAISTPSADPHPHPNTHTYTALPWGETYFDFTLWLFLVFFAHITCGIGLAWHLTINQQKLFFSQPVDLAVNSRATNTVSHII